MMSASRFAAAVVGLAAIAVSPALARAQEYRLGAITITRPWVRATPPGAPTAAGYLTIANHGAMTDRLLGGSSPEVGDIQVHEMSMTGNIMRMRPIAGGLAIAAGQTVVLAPGGDHHLMLIGPKRPLRAGDQVSATLRFERAGPVRVTFVVQESGVGTNQPMTVRHMEMH